MAKTILGIDVGHDQLKLALVKGKRVLRTQVADMPENLLRENHITSRDSLAELLRSTMRQNKLHANLASFVLPNESVFIKNVEVPLMSAEQLEYNLPFEFNDYITGDRRDYVFDYALLSDPPKPPERKKAQKARKKKSKSAEDDEDFDDTEAEESAGEASAEEGSDHIELMAVSAPRVLIEDARDSLRKAGLRLVVTAPAICSYIELIRAQQETLSEYGEEYGILDLGHRSIRMYMFHKDRHVATRVLAVGLSRLDDVLADAYGVDVHLAHTYLMSNYENCQERDECMSAYESIAVELMRAMNFYRFSNPNSSLSDLWACGGGAVIRPLIQTIEEMLDIQLHPASELVPGGDDVESCNSFVQAIGLAMS